MMKITCFTKRSWINALCCATLLFCSLIITQVAQSQHLIKVAGRVIERQTREPVPSIHIYTKSLKQGTVTNEQGRFIVSINRGDTLIFSSIGFDKYRFHLHPDDTRSFYEVVIEMDVKSYELEPVRVNAYSNLEEFKQDILQLNIPNKDKGFELNIPRGYTLPPEGPNDVNLNPSVTVRGAISALYDAFSREGKEKRMLSTYRKKSDDDKEVSTRYNLDVVKRITALEEEDAKSFMEWCNFEDAFILRASEYELTVAILHCLDEFNPTVLPDKK